MSLFLFFFFNDTATTEIYTLSLHDALPILSSYMNGVTRVPMKGSFSAASSWSDVEYWSHRRGDEVPAWTEDRKSTRLNSSHSQISYAVFCLQKKKQTHNKADYTSMYCVLYS